MDYLPTELQSVCDVTSSKRIYAEELCLSGVPFYRSKEIIEKIQGAKEHSNPLFISEDRYQEIIRNAGPLIEGDLLLTSRGTLGVPYLVTANDRFHFADGNLTWFRNFNGLDSRYLKYFFLSPVGKGELKRCVIGSSQAAYTIASLKKISIPLPDLEYQEKVVDILSAYDSLIENNNRRIAILENMAQSLYREWFVNFRFPGHENCKFVDSALGRVPEGWEIKPFGDLVDYCRNSIKKNKIEDGMLYIGLEHMPRKSMAISEWGSASQISSDKCEFLKGDILFGKIRPYFHKVGVALTNGVCSTDIFVWRPKASEYAAISAMVAFSDAFVAQATQTSQGTKMPRASWDVLKDYVVFIPVKEILEEFNSVVDSAIRQIGVLSERNRNLKEQRDMLLPRLVGGKIELAKEST